MVCVVLDCLIPFIFTCIILFSDIKVLITLVPAIPHTSFLQCYAYSSTALLFLLERFNQVFVCAYILNTKNISYPDPGFTLTCLKAIMNHLCLFSVSVTTSRA